MKKILFAAFAAAALAIGCSQDEVLNESPSLNQAIEFSTYTGKAAQTKGTVIDNGNLNSFGIIAFYTGTTPMATWTKTAANFMYNQEVIWNTSTNLWEYAPIKYWPTMDNDMISFYAYGPYATANNGITMPGKANASAPTSITFTVADKASDMVDFVAANAIDETQNQVAEGGRDAVKFNFKHELSRLAFMVKASEDLVSNTHIVLKSAELVADEKFYKSATYTWSDTEGELGTWSNKVKMTSNYNLWTSVAKGTVSIASTTYSQENAVDITLATAKNLLGDSEYLFLIPETEKNGTGTAAGALRVRFPYDIVTPDASLDKGYSITPADKTIDLPANMLKQSTAYNITFTFNMDQIEVSGSVEAWDTNVQTDEVDVPFTPDVE